jgi:hypothetical protein
MRQSDGRAAGELPGTQCKDFLQQAEKKYYAWRFI